MDRFFVILGGIVVAAVAAFLCAPAHAETNGWQKVPVAAWEKVAPTELLTHVGREIYVGGYGAVQPKKTPELPPVRYCMEPTIYGYFKQVRC